MASSFYQKLQKKIIHWLTKEPPPEEIPPYDYNRMKYEIRPADVLLIEGQSRVSNVIRTITQSPWTHAALYIGRLHDIEDNHLRKTVAVHMKKRENVRLIIEGMLGKGIIVSPLSHYRHHHIRICRPIGIAPTDAEQVISFAIKSLGQEYNVRQIFDLARFFLPWSVLPRRWGSILFRTPSGEPESGVCSTMIAEAFNSVQFPILPFLTKDKNGFEVIPRNPYLFTPKDFDFSPYFEIIKYPIFNPEAPAPYYRRMPWAMHGTLYQDGTITHPPKEDISKTESDRSPFNPDRDDS